MQEIRILSPIAILGYGVNAEMLQVAMEKKPTMIGVDSGSTDCGAYYLGSGATYQSRSSMKRDLTLILLAARKEGIPLVVGSAGLAGSQPHVQWVLDILDEIASEHRLKFKLATIYSDQEKDYLLRAIQDGRVTSFGGAPELTSSAVEGTSRIVAQMGTAPFVEALENGADVIVAGRSCDSAIFASFGVWQGFDRGLSLHMGKILECAGLSATPPTGRDPLIATLRQDSFVVESPNPRRAVTPRSLSSHMVYEVEHPFLQEEPEGTLDFSQVKLDPLLDGQATRVSGTLFHRRDRSTLRFEGAALHGYRSSLIGATRDPSLIAQVDSFMQGACEQVEKIEPTKDYSVTWRVYGRDGVLGQMEPMRERQDLHEVGLLVDVLAPTQERAHDIAALLEARMIGFDAPGAITRTAHIAFPYSPLITDMGGVYGFDVMHIVELNSEAELHQLFPIEYRNIDKS